MSLEQRDRWIDLMNATQDAIQRHPSVQCVCGDLATDHNVYDSKFGTFGCSKCGCHTFEKCVIGS